MTSIKAVGGSLGVVFNTLIVLGHTLMFIGAISALWGWYFIGLGNCIMMLVIAFDNDGYISRVRRQPKGLKGLGYGQWLAFYYFLTLLVIAVIFNLIFVITYFLGAYKPPFG